MEGIFVGGLLGGRLLGGRLLGGGLLGGGLLLQWLLLWLLFFLFHGFVFLFAAKLGWRWAIDMSFCGCRTIKNDFLFVGLFFLGIFAVKTSNFKSQI